VKILLVDDSADKIRRIIEVLKRVENVKVDDVVIAYNAVEAKKRLRNEQFDLLILDIALPERADQLPSIDGGISLLEEISARSIYNKPREIIGLTAFEDAFETAYPKFSKELWHVVVYSPSSKEWEERLEKKANYIQKALTNQERAEYRYDLCIITALPAPEFRAVLDLPWNWTACEVRDEIGEFKEGTFNAGGIRRVVASYASRPGMTAAATLAMRAIYNFRPRYLAMTGIAAGFKDQCAIGDILVADPSWDYGSGKWLNRGKKPEFEAAPHQIGLHGLIRSRFQAMARDSSVFDKIRSDWHGHQPESALKMLIGPVASGAAVRTDHAVAEEIRTQHRKTVGLEMEAYGIMAAAHESPLPEVKAFVVKSVSDFADFAKSDDYQPYAAYTSAQTLRVFAESYLIY
jgi:nucleoside phosphorylase